MSKRYRMPTGLSRIARLVVLSAAGLLFVGCQTLGYYAHIARGQSALVLDRRPVAKLLGDPQVDPKLKARLALSQQARRFASSQLGLPDNRSYTGYVALDRPYVVWNVFATPPYSVDAVRQCFPFAGCVPYRGYFTEAKAKQRAQQLKADGDDVWVGGVAAYSTLGWFADPILSSMLRWDDDELASTIFHELAHQLIYVKGDSAFNESFASFVQDEGLRQWRQSRGLPPQKGRSEAMDDGFTQLVLDLRDRLRKAYAQGGDETTLAAAKQREIEAFRQRYAQWRDHDWPGQHGYDAWVAAPINNARLLPFGIYDHWLPAFTELFHRSESQWPAFYTAVRTLAQQPFKQRNESLQTLLDAAQKEPPVQAAAP
ncbi:aminopeptidase [Dyella sp. GSA-30]|uniref:aminopeptidase n=1 Tax=Dyella sp. GSA-30 TaxID=2994496 RepID=UPI002492EAA5|nr:aminopeptidase [Dyella sp. GSA-30]